MKAAESEDEVKSVKMGIALGVVVGVAVGGAVGVLASIPNSATGVITSCLKSNGSITIIDEQAGQTCGNNATALRWNQTGPQGPAGATGPAGPAGAGGGGSTSWLEPFGDVGVGGNQGCAYLNYADGYGCGNLTAQAVNDRLGAGFRISAVDFPQGVTARLMVATELGSANTRLCVRLRTTNGSAVAGSEVCSAMTDSTPRQATFPPTYMRVVLESASFTLPPGDYLFQQRVDGAGELVVPPPGFGQPFIAVNTGAPDVKLVVTG